MQSEWVNPSQLAERADKNPAAAPKEADNPTVQTNPQRVRNPERSQSSMQKAYKSVGRIPSK